MYLRLNQQLKVVCAKISQTKPTSSVPLLEDEDPLDIKAGKGGDRKLQSCETPRSFKQGRLILLACSICVNLLTVALAILLISHAHKPRTFLKSEKSNQIFVICSSEEDNEVINRNAIGYSEKTGKPHLCRLAMDTNFTGNSPYFLINLVLSERRRLASTTRHKPCFHADVDRKQLNDDHLSWTGVDVGINSNKSGDGRYMKIKSHELVPIPETGLYHFYNQITIKSLHSTGGQTLSHTLYVIPKSNSASKPCQCLVRKKFRRTKGNMSFQTSLIDGDFYLRKGEYVQVKVSDNSAIYRYVNGNFLGFYLVN